MKRRRRGFSVLEAAVVVVIICSIAAAVLGTVGYVGYRLARGSEQTITEELTLATFTDQTIDNVPVKTMTFREHEGWTFPAKGVGGLPECKSGDRLSVTYRSYPRLDWEKAVVEVKSVR